MGASLYIVPHSFIFFSYRIKASNIDARVTELKKDNGQTSGKQGFWEEFESAYPLFVEKENIPYFL